MLKTPKTAKTEQEIKGLRCGWESVQSKGKEKDHLRRNLINGIGKKAGEMGRRR